MIDPCIPSDMKKFTVDRTYRGAKYHITVENPNGVEKGVKSLIVNDNAVDGNIIPVQSKDSIVDVHVVMG